MALRLYKIKLAVVNTENVSLHVVWRAEPEAKPQLSIGLLMEDDPGKPIWIPFADAIHVSHQVLAEDWIRTSKNLAAYEGRTVAAILLGFHHEQDTVARTVFDLYIGEIYAGAPATGSRPPAPSGFTVAASFMDGAQLHVRLRWQMRDQDAYYDLFRVSDEQRTWLGRIYGDCYYAEGLTREPGQPTTLELIATSREAPLSRSQPVRVVLASP